MFYNWVANLRWNKTGITVVGNTSFSGNGSSELNAPRDVIVDYQNTLYIADCNNNRIQKYMRGSTYGTTVAGNANGTSGNDLHALNTPSKVLVTSNGYIFVADTSNHRIMLWRDSSTSGVVVAGLTGKQGKDGHEKYLFNSV